MLSHADDKVGVGVGGLVSGISCSCIFWVDAGFWLRPLEPDRQNATEKDDSDERDTSLFFSQLVTVQNYWLDFIDKVLDHRGSE